MEELHKSDVDKAEKPTVEPKDEAPPLPVEADRSLSNDVEASSVPSLLRWLAWAIAVIIIAVLLVFFARWLYHVSHHAANPAPATSHKSPVSSSQNETSGKQPVSGNSSNGGPSSSTGSPAGSNSQTGSNSQITNTGPGNVVAVFAISSLAAAGLHFVIGLRRQARS